MLLINATSSSAEMTLDAQLPDIELHLENLPAELKPTVNVKKPTKTAVKKPMPVETAKVASVSKSNVFEAIDEKKSLPTAIIPEINMSPLPKAEDKAMTPITAVAASKAAIHQQDGINASLITLQYDKTEISISDANKFKLDQLVVQLALDERKSIQIVGYAYDKSDQGLNISDSVALQRVVAIRKYLLAQGINANKINSSNKSLSNNADKVDIVVIEGALGAVK
jgi:outer membrane protein OmpA-like peptidoglycan-associated protein